MSAALERAPVSDLEAEAAVLSALLVAAARYADAVRELVDPASFYSLPNRHVFAAVVSLLDRGELVDLVSVRGELKAAKRLEQVGGAAYLIQISDAIPAMSLEHVIQHAERVQVLARQREMVRTLHLVAAEGYQPRTTEAARAYLEECEARVYAAAQLRRQRESASVFSEIIGGALDAIQEGAQTQGPVLPGISTGLPSLDRLSGGMGAGDLWVVAGRPGMGKTSLVETIALAVARGGGLACVFSLEMSRRELGIRALARTSGVGGTAIRTARLSRANWDAVTAAAGALAPLPIVVDEGEELTPSRLRSRCRRYASENPGAPLRLVVVDYLQLMAADERLGSRQEELEVISRSLKRLARSLECTVIACSQLNRPKTDAKDKRPQLTDLRGSGALEQDPDLIAFVHREDVYRVRQEDHDGSAEILVAKGRACGTGNAALRYEGVCTRFVDDAVEEQSGFGFDDDDDLPY